MSLSLRLQFMAFIAAFLVAACQQNPRRYPANDPQSLWQQAASGDHSFRELGDDYYVDLPMKKVEGAQVVLINERAAARLGLTNAEDIRSLEQKLLNEFAYMIDQDHPEGVRPEKTWFATRYQDSHKKGAGEALGDGRAAWSGEVILKEGNQQRNVDFVLKGIGQTPLAWTNHAQETHKDGLQGLKEAIHSFIVSEANAKNQLDTTIDLAVIKLPIRRMSKIGEEVDTAITVRVGNQTRLAHLRYFTDNQQQFKRIFDYIVKRDLGIPSEKTVTPSMVENFIERFTQNIAEEMARYYDLHITHGSPTPGNRTTMGSSIDLSTMRYHEAHHGDFRYLANMKLADQEQHLQYYIRWIYLYMQEAKYPFQVTEAKVKEKEALYRKLINSNLEKLWLSRFGFSEAEIKDLPASKKRKFIKFLKEMHEAQSDKAITYAGRDMIPAAFDMRQVFRETSGLLLAVAEKDHNNIEVWQQILKSNKEWQNLSDSELKRWAGLFQSEFRELTSELPWTNSRLERWARKAKWMTKENDAIRGQSKLKLKEIDLQNRISQGLGSASEWSQEALELAEELKDPERPLRTFNNLAPQRSCSDLLLPVLK